MSKLDEYQKTLAEWHAGNRECIRLSIALDKASRDRDAKWRSLQAMVELLTEIDRAKLMRQSEG